MAGAITIAAKHKHDNVDRLAVGAVKIDRCFQRCKQGAGCCRSGNGCMGQRDAVTNGCAAKLLTVEDRIKDKTLTQIAVARHAVAQALEELLSAGHGMSAQQNARHQVRLDHGVAPKKRKAQPSG